MAIDAGRALPEALTLNEVRECLERLADLPTARLERLFVEHLDLCSYCLDAWQTGMLSRRLEALRYPPESDGEFDKRVLGSYLGAFGWLEDLRPAPMPEIANIEDVPESLREAERGRILTQPGNGGFIHGPSVNHAVAAAVLRNAYLTHASPEEQARMAIDLSSERVRTALSVLDGVCNGQDLGAILGYQFERHLIDRYPNSGLGQFILNFRQRYPLVADKITPDEDDEDIDTKESLHVLDGYALLEAAVLRENPLAYPYEVVGLPPQESDGGVAIMAEVDRLADRFDAIADLAMAEGVFQVAQGNYERAGAMLKAINDGGTPPEPDIVNTPRSGAAINLKVTLHLETTGTERVSGAGRQRRGPSPNRD